ncbi:hypothetical protein KV102_00810 [Mumia sp. zg.B53]|nr:MULTISPECIES: hypothetical protein [unclassified Mumia]MBW9208756.1 hypothetical protein [Mumia sp. zg.B21]MBW9213367.1 hypothetical protein [Mumia sp. zg.B53]
MDHYPHPLSQYPQYAEDPGNLAPAHLHRNQSAGIKNPAPDMGDPSENW